MAKGQVKVRLQDQYGNTETLWATPVGENLFELDNTPWYAYRVSWKDVVEGKATEAEGIYDFVQVTQKSGYRTIRVILKPAADESLASQRVLDSLKNMGCTYEGAHPGFFAVDIPPEVELHAVRDYLVSTGVEWEHGDPKYEDLFPES